MIKLKTIKTLTKKKNQKKKDQIKISIIPIEETKIKNLIWGIKLKTIKTLIKKKRNQEYKNQIKNNYNFFTVAGACCSNGKSIIFWFFL